MTDRERLIELINKSFAVQYEMQRFLTAEHTADDLLANGVIVPPCKVGDTVWVIDIADAIHHIKKRTVKEFLVGDGNAVLAECSSGIRHLYMFVHFGKTVFLTKEEAEKALAERIGK